MARQCIFCGKRANSGEHVWSEKLHPDLAPYLLHARDKSSTMYETPNANALDNLKLREGQMHKIKIQCVCSTCNNEWMNILDERVRPAVVKMIHGKPISLDEHMARDLTSWIAMKMMVTEQHYQKLTFSRQQCINFYRTRLPPEDFRVWIGQSGSQYTATMLHRQFRMVRTPLGFDRREMTVTWGLGRLLVFCEHSPGMQTFWPPNLVVAALWPFTNHVVDYPTPPLTVVEIDRESCRYLPQYQSAATHPSFFHPNLREVKAQHAKNRSVFGRGQRRAEKSK